MKSKTIAIISYITILGWIIAYLQYKDKAEKSQLVSYHLGQGLGVFIFAIVLSIIISVITMVIPSLSSIYLLIGLLPILLIIFGIIAANNEALKPVPLIGKFFEGRFNF